MQNNLQTSRLILRPFLLSDAGRVQELAGDFHIADTTWNVPHPYEDGMAEIWISNHEKEWQEKRCINFALCLKDTDKLIGAMSLFLIHPYLAELGYWTGKPFWNQGFTTEAGKEVFRYGFKELGLHKIYSSFLKRNLSSGRVMQKLGMKEEGYFKEHIQKWEKWENVYQYGLVREEWEYLEMHKCL